MNQTQAIDLRPSIIRSIIAVIVMYILYALTAMGYMGDNPVGQGSNYDTPLIVPAGYAFSIWSIIYLGITAFPIYQWFNRKEGHQLWKEVHSWFALNVIANGLWLVFASYDWLWLSLLVISFMLVTLYKINELLIKLHQSEANINYWLERVVMSIYFAWITLATALNVSAALSFYNWDGFGISQEIWSMIILPIAALIAGLVFRKYRDAAYACVVVWAFVAIVVKHMDGQQVLAIIAGVVALVFTGLVVFKSKKVLA